MENVFGQPIKNNVKKIENIQKITTSQGKDYTTGSLLDFARFFSKNIK